MDKLGKYLIRRELGKGAMGIVYEGFDPMIERIVAIKTIRPEQLNKGQAAEILARFKREAQAAGRLNHPHIVAIYEYGEDAPKDEGESIAYIAMEFIKGRERLLGEHLVHDGGHVAGEGFLAGEELVQDDAAGEEVAALVDRLAEELLG